jgi:hypothetical protein
MNSDEIASLVKSIVNTLLTSAAVSAYVNGNQAATLASAAGVLAVIVYGIYTRWNQRLVPEKSVVTSAAATVAVARAVSAPAEAVAAAAPVHG